jgi:hypothetical protein
MVFVCQRRAEQGHDPVAHHLVHRALVVMDGLHHALQHGVEEPARLFRIPIGEDLHRAFEICEEDAHLLALALQSALGSEDPVG